MKKKFLVIASLFLLTLTTTGLILTGVSDSVNYSYVFIKKGLSFSQDAEYLDEGSMVQMFGSFTGNRSPDGGVVFMDLEPTLNPKPGATSGQGAGMYFSPSFNQPATNNGNFSIMTLSFNALNNLGTVPIWTFLDLFVDSADTQLNTAQKVYGIRMRSSGINSVINNLCCKLIMGHEIAVGGPDPATSPQNSVTYEGIAFANLGTPSNNGVMVYCNNCTIANPCATGGSGAFAKRLNGVWVCN